MAIELSEEQLKNIKEYRYSACPATALDKVYDPWWEFVVNRLPRVSVIRLIFTYYLDFGAESPDYKWYDCANFEFHLLMLL